MNVLRVEQVGQDLVVKLPANAEEAFGLRAGDSVVIARSFNGEVSLAPSDLDHELRLERSRAFLRRYRSPV